MQANNKIVAHYPVLFSLLTLLLAGCGGGGGGSSSSVSSTPAQPQLGVYGGGTASDPATLQLTSTGGTLTGPCGSVATLAQPLTTDSGGNFDVPASGSNTQFVGTVRGTAITIHERIGAGTQAYDTNAVVVVYGQTAPTFTGECPG